MNIETLAMRLILSWSMAIFVLACGVEAWRIASSIKNARLRDILKRISVGLVSFFVARLAAALTDGYFQLLIPFASYTVNFLFWFWVLYHFRRQRKIVQSDSVGEAGRRRLSVSIEQIIEEMTREQEKLISVG